MSPKERKQFVNKNRDLILNLLQDGEILDDLWKSGESILDFETLKKQIELIKKEEESLKFEDFAELTGMIIEDEVEEFLEEHEKELEALKLYNEIEENGMIDANTKNLKAMQEFCNNNQSYHIVTQTEDDGKLFYYNTVTLVNRLSYYFAKGKELQSIICEITG